MLVRVGASGSKPRSTLALMRSQLAAKFYDSPTHGLVLISTLRVHREAHDLTHTPIYSRPLQSIKQNNSRPGVAGLEQAGRTTGMPFEATMHGGLLIRLRRIGLRVGLMLQRHLPTIRQHPTR